MRVSWEKLSSEIGRELEHIIVVWDVPVAREVETRLIDRKYPGKYITRNLCNFQGLKHLQDGRYGRMSWMEEGNEQ